MNLQGIPHLSIPAVRTDLKSFVQAAADGEAIAYSHSVALGGKELHVIPNLHFYILFTKDKKLNFYYFYGEDSHNSFCLIALGETSLAMQGTMLMVQGKDHFGNQVTMYIDSLGSFDIH